MSDTYDRGDKTGNSWYTDMLSLVTRHYWVGEEFTLDDVMTYAPELAAKHPRNRHVADKIRQQLQNLRDKGVIEFLDNRGHYRRIS